jgi:DNA-directed RNA polymerase subunit alpha
MSFYNKTNGVSKENLEALSETARAYLNRPVAELEFSVRSMNMLKNAGITTVRELVTHTDLELLKYREFGRKSLNEIKQILSEMGLSLGMKLGK